jgi:hypothetical protein
MEKPTTSEDARRGYPCGAGPTEFDKMWVS